LTDVCCLRVLIVLFIHRHKCSIGLLVYNTVLSQPTYAKKIENFQFQSANATTLEADAMTFKAKAEAMATTRKAKAKTKNVRKCHSSHLSKA